MEGLFHLGAVLFAFCLSAAAVGFVIWLDGIEDRKRKKQFGVKD